MSQFPSLPLFTDAWVAATNHLTRLERGTYCDLLVLMWRTPGCRVPNDDAWLSKRLRMTAEEVKFELRPIIEEFCRCEGNWITQKRLSKEYIFVTRQSQQRSVSAKARWDKEKDICGSSTGSYDSRNAPTPTPIKNTSSSFTEPRDPPPVDGVENLQPAPMERLQAVDREASKPKPGRVSTPYLDASVTGKGWNSR